MTLDIDGDDCNDITYAYSPEGMRMLRENDTSSIQYIVDPSGAYPMVLMERDPDSDNV